MANLFAKLVESRLQDVEGWLAISKDESYDASTREWGVQNASEEMSKIDDDFRTLKRNVSNFDVKGIVGSKVANEYDKMKERLNECLDK